MHSFLTILIFWSNRHETFKNGVRVSDQMKKQFLFPILLLSLISTHCLSETMDDLYVQDGIYYKKFTETPFTGEITEEVQGNYKNGEKVSKNLGDNEEFFNWLFARGSRNPKLNMHKLMHSKNFLSFRKRNLNSKKQFFLGMTKGEEETLSYHLHEVLGSSDKVREVRVKDGVLNISGCRYKSCDEKGLVWIDTRSNKEIFVILHYFYNDSEYQPKGDLLVFSNDYDSARELPKRFRIDLLNWKKRHKLNNEIRVRFHTTE